MIISSTTMYGHETQELTLIKFQLGQMKILEIRSRLAKRDDFDLAAFHSKLLSMGAVPLEVLEEEMLNDTAI